MLKKVFLYFMFIAFLLPIYSCVNNSVNTIDEPILIGSVDKIKIDHVFSKREGCRFTNIYFNVTLENISETTQQFNFSSFSNHCERTIDTTNLHWIVNKEKMSLAVSPKDSIFKFQPKESRTLVLKGMFDILGRSMSEIYNHYESYFESDFEISFQNNANKFLFKKNDDFHINMYLDDTLINKSDSLKYTLYLKPKFRLD